MMLLPSVPVLFDNAEAGSEPDGHSPCLTFRYAGQMHKCWVSEDIKRYGKIRTK